jgi:peptide/nickel transport system permease protein
MADYLARRILYAVITLLGITVAVFALIHAVPGDPISYYASSAGRALPPEIVERIRAEHHLDDPLPVQYARWLGRTARLDFGESFVDRRPVIRRIGERLPRTLVLNLSALLLALAVAIPLGFWSAARPGRLIDRGSALVLVLLYSLPTFWVALLLVRLFSLELGLFPLFGLSSDDYGSFNLLGKVADRAWHLTLPVITLAVGQFALFARFLRSAVLESAAKPFTVAARARGVTETRALVAHAGRNALVPLVTLLGVAVPYLLSGSVVVETIFALDGMGRLYFDSVMARDYPTIMALTVIGAVVTLAAYLCTDLIYPLVDPRIRIRREEQ